MADTDILLGGFGLFGGRGEYTAKLKVNGVFYYSIEPFIQNDPEKIYFR